MRTCRAWVIACLSVVVLAGTAIALNMETVSVGNPGNAGEWSGGSYGGFGPDHVCGAVGYMYNIGKYEVTAGQYCEFLNAVGGVDAHNLYNPEMWSNEYGCKIERYAGSGTTGDPYQYRISGDWANRPVNYVSWGDAARFVNWLHNGQRSGAQDVNTTEDGAYYLNDATTDAQLLMVSREADWRWAIPTEDEWYKAAYHKNDGATGHYWDYPTGSDAPPGQDMADIAGNNANHYAAPYAFPIDGDKYLTVAGEFQDSDSAYGTFDQGGNVWEWNEAVFYDSIRGLRGGSFRSGLYASDDLHAALRGIGTSPSGEFSYNGFRVCSVPEPTAIALLICGVSLFVRRKRLLNRPLSNIS